MTMTLLTALFLSLNPVLAAVDRGTPIMKELFDQNDLQDATHEIAKLGDSGTRPVD